MNPYESYLNAAIEIAEKASKVAVSYFRQALLIEMKENQTPVTIADKKTEETIRMDLKELFPDHGIVGEELGSQPTASEYLWTIDPIDGTRSFIRGIPLFGTLMALLRKGKPVVGVMVLPVLEETYFAAEGMGTFCNGTRLHVSTTKSLGSALVSCGDINCFEDSGRVDYLDKLQKNAGIVRGYTDCFGHSLVLRGAVDAMVDPVVWVWDVAPLAVLVSEAGGDYFTLDGERTHMGKSFVSATPALKKELVGL